MKCIPTRLIIYIGIFAVLFPMGKAFASPVSQSQVIDFTDNPPSEQQVNLIFTVDGIMPLKSNQSAFYLSKTYSIPVVPNGPFITFAPVLNLMNYDENYFLLFVRFSRDSMNWNSWEAVDRAAHPSHDDSTFYGEMKYLENTTRYYEFRLLFSSVPGARPPIVVRELRLDFFTPGDTPPINPESLTTSTLSGQNQNCSCPLPFYATRTEWNCPDEQNPSCSSPAIIPVSHIVLHHSAGPNTSSNWAATVLAIWNLHINTNGWCDIGYNWLIDPDGIVYQGRGGGNNVRGAHVCGKNSGTMGVCLLGNFETEAPTEAAMTSLQKLLTWKSCDSGLDPTASGPLNTSGTVIPVISGHQDVCNTLCPGLNFFHKLDEIRTDVAAELAVCAPDSVTAIEPLLSVSEVIIYPNPTDDRLTIQYEGSFFEKGEITLYDMFGKQVLHKPITIFPGNNRTTLSANHLPAGMYQVRFSVDTQAHHEKVLVYR